jgi:heme/copper-type cytochrome/quinol oxidase subunit 2
MEGLFQPMHLLLVFVLFWTVIGAVIVYAWKHRHDKPK